MSLLEKLQNSRNALGWAFMLPAAMAGVLSVMRRAGRGRGAIVGAGLAVAAIAAVAFIDPGLLTARRV